MPVGVLINTAAIFLGGIVGALVGGRIPQRINERQQRRMMPRRYWKHLTEME